MSANRDIATQTAQKKTAQGKKRSGIDLAEKSKHTTSLESAKEADWPVVLLGEIAEIKLGKMLDKAKHRTGRRLPYLRNINVRWGTIETDDLFEMNFEEDQIDRFGLQANDVLVCEGGEPGRASVWNGHLPNLKFQKALHRVRFKVPFEPRLLVYLLELLAKSGSLERRFTGSTIKHFTREAFLKLPIPFPPEAEQRRIVAEIEKQLTRLEAGVTALRRVQANLNRYRAAVLKAACEGRLSSSEEWEQTTLGQVSTVLSGYGFPERLQGRSIGEFAFYKVGDISAAWKRNEKILTQANHYINTGDLTELRAKLLPSGTVVFAKIGAAIALNRRAIIDRPSLVDNNVMGLLAGSRITPRFLYHYVCTLKLDEYSRATTVPSIRKGDVEGIHLKLPPLAEQTLIVAEIERRLSMAEELEAAVSVNLIRAKRLRYSILQQAFTGTL